MSTENMDVDNDQNDANNENDTKQETETDSEREARALKLKAEGNKKYSSKKYTEAINLYTQAIEAFPDSKFYGNRAAAYMALNKFKKALSDCLFAIKLDRKYNKAYIRGVKCYTELAQFDSAQKLAKEGLALFPHDKDLKQGHSRVDIIQNKLGRINEKLSKISLKYDSFFESHLNPQTKTNNDSKSESEEIKENGTEEMAQITHKLSAEDHRQIDVAISMITSLLNNDLSQSLPLKCTNIRALIIKQNYESALSNATNLMRWNKDNNRVCELRAIALFRNGNSDSAIKHLQQILRKDPDNGEIKSLFKLFKSIGRQKESANKAFKSGDLDLALSKYSACLALDRPNHGFNCIIYSNRAAVWLKQKEWQRAYDDSSNAIALDSSYIKAYGRRIQSLYGLDRYDEAVGDAEKALALEPSSNDLKQQLRHAKIELKKSKRKDYYKVLGVGKDATEKEIKKGFRAQAMQWHPDKFASEDEAAQKKAEDKFKDIGEAYEVLKDPKMKQRYDSGVDIDQLKSGGFGGFGGGGGVDISHIFDLLGGMHGGHGGHGGGGHGGRGGPQNFTFRFG